MKTIITIQFFVLMLISSLLTADVARSNLHQTPEIEKANQQLEQARITQQQSRQVFINANKIRNQLKNLRAKKHQKKQDTSSADEQIAMLVGQLEAAQQQAAEKRAQSELLRREAIANFTQGFINHWGEWIGNTQPLTMDSSVESFFAHNSRVRSVHKNMPTSSLSEQVSTRKRNDMSLQVPGLVSQNAPPDLDIGAFKFSRKEKLFAHIEVHVENKTSSKSDNSTNVAAVPLNQIHQWRLLVTDLKGNPVENIQFEVEGHMPGHVHGLPTAPRVMGEIKPGVYLVDGLKFQMKGWWVMKFVLKEQETTSNSTQADFFTFNLVL